MKLYRIRNWNVHYENNRTRELKQMAWVPVPNSHDGDGYTELVSRENGAAMLGAWLVILQVASRCDPRGTLLRKGGIPHSPSSLSRITRLPEGILKEALDICSGVLQWIEIVEVTPKPQDGAGKPQDGAPPPQGGDEEGKGREGTELNRNEGCDKKSKDATSIASSMTPINYYEQIDARAGALFGRTTPANAYAEQSAISEISRRLDALGELAEIEVFHRKPGNFFPQSLSKLLSAWQETLDRARTHDTRKQNHETPTKNNQQRVDRSIGTSNEGRASEYEGLGRLAKA